MWVPVLDWVSLASSGGHMEKGTARKALKLGVGVDASYSHFVTFILMLYLDTNSEASTAHITKQQILPTLDFSILYIGT